MVRRCENILRETRSRVRVGEGLSEVFWTGRRVRQGYPLSPGLFNLLTADLEEFSEEGRMGRGEAEGRKGVHTCIRR